ncbi:MAG: efflux RND transporter permease subunit [Deltaproteobacteria bacterium]|nr:efflux RND transporter permease subunit [Deltaproteobacteria bacterium]
MAQLMEGIVRAFIESKLTPLTILAALCLGVFAILATPREEEPQIIGPMMEVFVEMPGASVKEMEERVTIPMEKKLSEIPGVEYIYSTTGPGLTVGIVRFYVGEKEEDSLVKLYNKLYSNFDLIPPGASQPLVKPRSIDDVPILSLSLWSDRYDHFTIRRIAAELDDEIKSVPDVSETRLIGGQRRQIRVTLDTSRMAAFHTDPARIASALSGANKELRVGSFAAGNREVLVDVGEFLDSPEAVGNLVIDAFGNRPVYLRDVADVRDAPEEPADYVFFGAGPGAMAKGIRKHASALSPAVTLSVAKRKGTNAVIVAERILARVEELKGKMIPGDVHITVTRNYGETAREKSNELLEHLLLATVSVTVLIALFLGMRASVVVLTAVPVTLILTLFIYFIYGYTLNRVTLFALIFSIGILVDDPIVDVENIVRHFRMPGNKGRSRVDVTIEAVNEVRSPLILATFTVIAAILPMAFVRGLMGPYMRPIPVGASTAMLLSMGVAFVITPWAALRLLGRRDEKERGEKEGRLTRFYRRMMRHLIYHPTWRTVFLFGVAVLLFGAIILLYVKLVTVKMLPFDNKSEFQVIIDMPEGSTLEETARVAKEIGTYLGTVSEVTDYQLYAGAASPYNFNGLVRHYFLRRGPNVADIQVNLLPKGERKAQSHDIAKRVRPRIHEIAARFGARVKVAEAPPGPPVLQTLVAEIYGPEHGGQIRLADRVKRIFESTPGVVDTDWYVEDPQPKLRLTVDREKAAYNGITADQVVQSLRIALGGAVGGLAHMEREKEDVPILLRLARSERSDARHLQSLKLLGLGGKLVPLSEITRSEETIQMPNIYRKNLKRVVYVTGDVAGREESPVYAILRINEELGKIGFPSGGNGIPVYMTHQPSSTATYAVKWDGEWHVTYEVFRDLGIAFAAVLVLIYILVVAWFQSFKTPLVIMAPIPLSLVGILPAHSLMGAFFTATSMIGFIAGAGIVVRNSIILVDFVELRRREGMSLAEAVIDAGAVRFRPMLLTASAVVVGSAVILFDPIFQGLAISLMAGEVASTLLSRMAVPVLYYLSERK